MKKTVVFASIIIIFLCTGNRVFAQYSRWSETRVTADSSQRSFLRKELLLEDSVITAFFSVRDYMYREVAQIRGGTQKDEKVQDAQIAEIRRHAEDSIFNILGAAKFKMYTDKIMERLTKSGKQGYKPLTGNSN